MFTADGRLQHRVLGLWGGERSQAQYRELEKGVDVVVSTPGRLIDLLNKKCLSLSQFVLEFSIMYSIRYFVLDEADKACDIEMENQIRTVFIFPFGLFVDCKSVTFCRCSIHCITIIALLLYSFVLPLSPSQ